MVHIYELTFSGIEQQIELELIEERIPETALKQHSSILEAASVRQEERTPQQRQLLDHYVPDHKSMIARVGWLGTARPLPFGLGAVIAGCLAAQVLFLASADYDSHGGLRKLLSSSRPLLNFTCN